MEKEIVIRIDGLKITDNDVSLRFIDGFLTCVQIKLANGSTRQYLDETWYEQDRQPEYEYLYPRDCFMGRVPQNEQYCMVSDTVKIT